MTSNGKAHTKYSIEQTAELGALMATDPDLFRGKTVRFCQDIAAKRIGKTPSREMIDRLAIKMGIDLDIRREIMVSQGGPMAADVSQLVRESKALHDQLAAESTENARRDELIEKMVEDISSLEALERDRLLGAPARVKGDREINAKIKVLQQEVVALEIAVQSCKRLDGERQKEIGQAERRLDKYSRDELKRGREWEKYKDGVNDKIRQWHPMGE